MNLGIVPTSLCFLDSLHHDSSRLLRGGLSDDDDGPAPPSSLRPGPMATRSSGSALDDKKDLDFDSLLRQAMKGSKRSS